MFDALFFWVADHSRDRLSAAVRRRAKTRPGPDGIRRIHFGRSALGHSKLQRERHALWDGQLRDFPGQCFVSGRQSRALAGTGSSPRASGGAHNKISRQHASGSARGNSQAWRQLAERFFHRRIDGWVYEPGCVEVALFCAAFVAGPDIRAGDGPHISFD